MPLTPGTRLGPYEVTAQIGVGGMGEVYQATDTNLKRSVAIKVLPASVAGDAERLARFQREAEVLAALNHPNIAQIHGLEKSAGTIALVMELVEGPTLEDRIAQGAIPVDEALPIAKQIAEALEAAHEQGIIHRDLKPANVKLRPDGVVKVLDFGLAKALEPTGAMSPGMSQAPTITTPAMTQAGMILGTAAYMSPEQARGKPVDKRADIWAFGAVLYEMLTGQRAFPGEDITDTLAAVVKLDPRWDAVSADVPSRVLQAIRVCLRKDPQQRVRDIHAVRLALEGAFETAAPPATEGPVTPVVTLPLWRRALPVAAALVVGGLVVWGVMRPAPQPPAPIARFSILLATGESFTLAGGRHIVALSPAGTHVAYTVNNGLSLRPVDQLQATPMSGTEGNARNPFFSPDGQQVGFHADGQLKRVSISGGAPVTLAEASNPWGTSWGADNMILYGQGPQGIWRVPGTGGTPEQVIPVEVGELAHGPQLLPGGEWVLFTLAEIAAGSWDQAQIVVQSLATDERIVLIDGGRDARYLPTGHLVYGLNGVLLAVPFDLTTRQVTGGPVPLVEGVLDAGVTTGAVQFSIAATGSLVYVPAGGVQQQRTLVWVDRQGREEPLAAPPRAYQYPRLSPDGTRVALDLWDQEDDIWIWDLARETLTRLTFDPGIDRFPVWTPDSTRVVFGSTAGGVFNLYWKAADGTGTVERLTESADLQIGHSFSPDGESLLFRETQPDTGADLRVLSLAGDRGVETLQATEFDEFNGEISPDGRWMAYESNQSGQVEVYVRPFPNVDDGQWQISTSGGTRPVWAPSGRELFYLRGAALMTVPVQAEPSFTPATPEVLLEGNYFTGELTGRTYDVAPDGQRFLMITVGAGTEDTSAPPSLILVQNWFEELRRLVPTN